MGLSFVKGVVDSVMRLFRASSQVGFTGGGLFAPRLIRSSLLDLSNTFLLHKDKAVPTLSANHPLRFELGGKLWGNIVACYCQIMDLDSASWVVLLVIEECKQNTPIIAFGMWVPSVSAVMKLLNWEGPIQSLHMYERR